MTSEDFVRCFYLHYKHLINAYFDPNSELYVSGQIQELLLEKGQKEKLKEILSGALTDAFYSVLLGLDGSAQIGGRQVSYKLQDEEGNELAGGEIEGFAWEYFHGDKSINE